MKINNIPNILQDSLTDIKFRMNQIDYNQNNFSKIVCFKGCKSKLLNREKTFFRNDPSTSNQFE